MQGSATLLTVFSHGDSDISKHPLQGETVQLPGGHLGFAIVSSAGFLEGPHEVSESLLGTDE